MKTENKFWFKSNWDGNIQVFDTFDEAKKSAEADGSPAYSVSIYFGQQFITKVSSKVVYH